MIQRLGTSINRGPPLRGGEPRSVDVTQKDAVVHLLVTLNGIEIGLCFGMVVGEHGRRPPLTSDTGWHHGMGKLDIGEQESKHLQPTETDDTPARRAALAIARLEGTPGSAATTFESSSMNTVNGTAMTSHASNLTGSSS